MVTVRLSRFGRKKAPFYRIVAMDSGKKAKGMALEILGFWNPAKKLLKIDGKKLKEFEQKGAQISAAVKKLLTK